MVLDLRGVTIRRGGTTILDSVSWIVADGQRWVVLGPNGAGKTTLLQIASGRMHPTSGTAMVLGCRLGAVDVFDLRPRVGVASAALADRIPPTERVLDVVLTAAYGTTGRWREAYEALDHERAHALLDVFGVGELADRTFGTLSEGERKRADDRPGAAAARRTRRGPGPRRAGGAPAGPDGAGRRPPLAGDGAGHPPRRGDPRRLHARPAAPGWARQRGRPVGRRPDTPAPVRDVRHRARGGAARPTVERARARLTTPAQAVVKVAPTPPHGKVLDR